MAVMLYDLALGPRPPKTYRRVPHEWDDPVLEAVEIRADIPYRVNQMVAAIQEEQERQHQLLARRAIAKREKLAAERRAIERQKKKKNLAKLRALQEADRKRWKREAEERELRVAERQRRREERERIEIQARNETCNVCGAVINEPNLADLSEIRFGQVLCPQHYEERRRN